MTKQHIPTLIPKRGVPSELELKNCYLISGGNNETPCFENRSIYLPDDTAQSSWADDEWYAAFRMAGPQKIVVREYRRRGHCLWVEDGMVVDDGYKPTGRILEGDQ